MNKEREMMGLIRSLLDVPSADPDDARRRKLLNIFLASVVALFFFGLLAVAVFVVGGMAAPEEGLWICTPSLILLGGAVIIWAINRYRSGEWASALFLLLMAVAIAVTDEPRQVVAGRSLFMFTIPILMASVLLRPYASFIMVGVVSLLLVMVALSAQLDRDVLGSLPFATLAFTALALISWLSARGLEQALKDVRTINQELDQRVAQRTQALDQALSQLAVSYQREQERLRLSDTLREVAKIVSSTLEQQEVLDLILTHLESVVTYHSATVTLLSDDKLTLVAGRDKQSGEIERFTIPVDQYPLNVEALREKQPILVLDVARDQRWQVGSLLGSARSFINAPLLAKNRPIGLLCVARNDETPYTQEDAQTVFAFANQVAVALESARLHAYELWQVERELAIARQIQTSLLPAGAPAIAGLDIAGFSEPARYAGGDFYNYFVFDQGHIGIAVGDVSGKGIQAALMMTMSFGLLATQVRHNVSPALLLAELNRALYPHTQRNGFNTALCYLTMRPKGSTWEVCAANAGLIAPLLHHADGTLEWLDVMGWPLGLKEEMAYGELSQELAQGSLLVMCSDGLVEVVNESGEMYSFDRLAERVACVPGQPDAGRNTRGRAQALCEWILDDIRAFAGSAEPYDDLTLVVVAVGEAGPSE